MIRSRKMMTATSSTKSAASIEKKELTEEIVAQLPLDSQQKESVRTTLSKASLEEVRHLRARAHRSLSSLAALNAAFSEKVASATRKPVYAGR